MKITFKNNILIGKTDVTVVVSEWMACTGKITLPVHSVNVIELK